MESGQRIDLEKLEPAGGVAAKIDASGVPATQQLHHLHRQPGGLVRQRFIRDQSVLRAVQILVLVELRVGVNLGALVPDHLHHRHDAGARGVADDADSDLASGQELFDKQSIRKVR